MKKLELLYPQPLFNYFEAICQIPRPSKKEEKIRQFLLDFAENNRLQAKTDKAGNVLILKPATAGMENSPTVILQTHMDMVCEKNSDKIFNFDTDAIEPRIEEGWVKANGTTLGADCGIGIAAQMAVLSANDLKHGPIECLITVDEETGLTGAFALEAGFLSGSVLLNLDSEDEGEIFIGCAGGIDTLATFNYKKEEVSEKSIALKLSVAGLLGGHSGDDIDKNRGNANKLLNQFLVNNSKKYGLNIGEFNGGNLRNAIAREAFVIIVIPKKEKENLISDFKEYSKKTIKEWQNFEPDLKFLQENVEVPDFVIDKNAQENLTKAISDCPHGVLRMSENMEGMVETSTNLASVKFIEGNKILVITSQRSEIAEQKQWAANLVFSVFSETGAEVKHSDGYPGWAPNTDSEILKITVDSYKKMFGVNPIVRSIHAGLECGLFLEKYPNLDMVSFGPTIRGAHSPDERLDIKTTEKFWKHLLDVLENIK